jgi:hypothetical protein
MLLLLFEQGSFPWCTTLTVYYVRRDPSVRPSTSIDLALTLEQQNLPSNNVREMGKPVINIHAFLVPDHNVFLTLRKIL